MQSSGFGREPVLLGAGNSISTPLISHVKIGGRGDLAMHERYPLLTAKLNGLPDDRTTQNGF